MDVFVDKGWVKLNRAQDHYRKSLVAFLDYAFATSALDNKIACPCGTCGNRFYHDRQLVMKHMIMKGMDVEYQNCIWIYHGESRVIIARMENVSEKRKLITREHLVQMSSRTSKAANQMIRRSPRNHVVATPSTSFPSARKSLFSSKEATKVPAMEGQLHTSTTEKDARKRWSMLLNSMAQRNQRNLEDEVPVTPSNPQSGLHNDKNSNIAITKSVGFQYRHLQSDSHSLRRSPRHVNTSDKSANTLEGNVNGNEESPEQQHTFASQAGNDLTMQRQIPVQHSLRRSPRHANLTNQNTNIIEGSTSQGGYKNINRRRIQAAITKNRKCRGGNKTKVLKDPIFVEVNEFGQPIGDAERTLSSLIGCLARDPRRLPLDCWDWRKLSQQKKDAVWEEVKQSYTFPEGQEPYDWAMQTMNAAWRLEKCELKIAHFDGRTHNEALARRSEVPYIPEDMWKNLVDFWESPKGQARSKTNTDNRSKLIMCHYAGTKSFARIRAEKKKKDGKEPDALEVWLHTHQPKKGARLDKASEAKKKSIEEDLTALPLDSCTDEERMRIFKKHVGDNKNGYAKTYGLGVKVPRSRGKRCALEEERAKRIKSENKVEKLEKKLDKVTSIMKKFLELQGVEPHELSLSCSSTDDGAEGGEEGGCNEGEHGESSRVRHDEF